MQRPSHASRKWYHSSAKLVLVLGYSGADELEALSFTDRPELEKPMLLELLQSHHRQQCYRFRLHKLKASGLVKLRK